MGRSKTAELIKHGDNFIFGAKHKLRDKVFNIIGNVRENHELLD